MNTDRPNPATGVAPEPSPYRDGGNADRHAWGKLCNLQRRMLPKNAPPISGYEFALAYRPAFVVTGDYHDFFLRSDGDAAVFVGDGSGHGPAAGMLMAMMRTILQTHPDVHARPGETLTRAGAMFHRLIPSDLFMTGVYVCLGGDGSVSWSCAGHHPPLRVGSSGELYPVDLAVIGHVLGASANEEYETVTWTLQQGERLVLFTDGLWDARSHIGEPFGRKRLFQYWSEATTLQLTDAVSQLLARVETHLEGTEFEDDFTVIAIERRR